jgi:hypothetical protein
MSTYLEKTANINYFFPFEHRFPPKIVKFALDVLFWFAIIQLGEGFPLQPFFKDTDVCTELIRLALMCNQLTVLYSKVPLISMQARVLFLSL